MALCLVVTAWFSISHIATHLQSLLVLSLFVTTGMPQNAGSFLESVFEECMSITNGLLRKVRKLI